MLILACSASPQQPVCWPDALNERRNFFYCCWCIVRSVHELPRNGSGSVASYYGFACVVMSLVRREFTMLCRLQKNGWCRVEFKVNVQLFVGSGYHMGLEWIPPND